MCIYRVWVFTSVYRVNLVWVFTSVNLVWVFTCVYRVKSVLLSLKNLTLCILNHLLQGSPQYVRVDLGQSAFVSELHMQFQGGFAGRECELRVGEKSGKEGTVLMQFHPSDNNSLQVSYCMYTWASK